MNKEFSLKIVIKLLKAIWWKLLIAVVIASVGAGLFSYFFIDKRYASDVKFYIFNDSGYLYSTSSLTSAAQDLANDYIEIISSDTMVGIVSDKLLEEYGITASKAAIRQMLSFSVVEDTSAFVVSVSSTNPYISYYVADYIAVYAPDVIRNFTKAALVKDSSGNLVEPDECVKILRDPTIAKSSYYPDVFKNCMLAAVAAIIIVGGFYLLKTLFDTVIRTEEDLKENINCTFLGVIPSWETFQGKNKGGYSK